MNKKGNNLFVLLGCIASCTFAGADEHELVRVTECAKVPTGAYIGGCSGDFHLELATELSRKSEIYASYFSPKPFSTEGRSVEAQVAEMKMGPVIFAYAAAYQIQPSALANYLVTNPGKISNTLFCYVVINATQGVAVIVDMFRTNGSSTEQMSDQASILQLGISKLSREARRSGDSFRLLQMNKIMLTPQDISGLKRDVASLKVPASWLLYGEKMRGDMDRMCLESSMTPTQKWCHLAAQNKLLSLPGVNCFLTAAEAIRQKEQELTDAHERYGKQIADLQGHNASLRGSLSRAMGDGDTMIAAINQDEAALRVLVSSKPELAKYLEEVNALKAKVTELEHIASEAVKNSEEATEALGETWGFFNSIANLLHSVFRLITCMVCIIVRLTTGDTSLEASLGSQGAAKEVAQAKNENLRSRLSHIVTPSSFK